MGERAPLLARAVGGRVLGPRPGLAILSFWQGILEIVLRTLALVSPVNRLDGLVWSDPAFLFISRYLVWVQLTKFAGSAFCVPQAYL